MKKIIAVVLGLLVLLAVTLAIVPTTRDEIHWLWASHKNETKRYESYLKTWPTGLHATEAKRLHDERSWVDAQAANTFKALQHYLDEHPTGRFVKEAKSKQAAVLADDAPFLAAQQKSTEEAFLVKPLEVIRPAEVLKPAEVVKPAEVMKPLEIIQPTGVMNPIVEPVPIPRPLPDDIKVERSDAARKAAEAIKGGLEVESIRKWGEEYMQEMLKQNIRLEERNRRILREQRRKSSTPPSIPVQPSPGGFGGFGR